MTRPLDGAYRVYWITPGPWFPTPTIWYTLLRAGNHKPVTRQSLHTLSVLVYAFPGEDRLHALITSRELGAIRPFLNGQNRKGLTASLSTSWQPRLFFLNDHGMKCTPCVCVHVHTHRWAHVHLTHSRVGTPKIAVQFKFKMSLQNPNGAFWVKIWEGLMGDRSVWWKECSTVAAADLGPYFWLLH